MTNPFRNMDPSKIPFVYAGIGALLALVFFILGVWRTLVVLAFAAFGYWFGKTPNKSDFIREKINKWFPPKN